MDKANSLHPSAEFMERHREIREASERVLSVTLDPQTAAHLAQARAKEDQEMGK